MFVEREEGQGLIVGKEGGQGIIVGRKGGEGSIVEREGGKRYGGKGGRDDWREDGRKGR